MPNGEEAGLGIIPSKQRWERKMKCKNRTLRFGAYGRSSTSLDRSCSTIKYHFDNLSSFRSTGTLNKHHGKQKISFSRKFPFMKSRERLNKLDDEDSFENGSNHRWVFSIFFYSKNLFLAIFAPPQLAISVKVAWSLQLGEH